MLSALLFSVALQQTAPKEVANLKDPEFYELQKSLFDSHKKLSDVMFHHTVKSTVPGGEMTGSVVKKTLNDILWVQVKLKGAQSIDAEYHLTKHRALMIVHSQKLFVNFPFPEQVSRSTKLFVPEYVEPDQGNISMNFADEAHQIGFLRDLKIVLKSRSEGEFEVLKGGKLTKVQSITFLYSLKTSGPVSKSATITISTNPLLLLELTVSKAEEEESAEQVVHRYKLKELVTNAGFTPADMELAPDALKGYRSAGGLSS